MKKCSKCKELKPLDQFYAQKGGRDGLRADCKACMAAYKAAAYRENPEKVKARVRKWQQENPDRYREKQRKYREENAALIKSKLRSWYLEKTYGITVEQYNEIFARQGGRCAICGAKPNAKISLHVDHSHKTGKIRGLLCFRCNNGIGDFRENPVILHKAASYIVRDHPPEPEVVDRIGRRVAALRPS
jgi:hypothetical protein